MLHAVVMAGGSGTRFWPASRNEQPKQLLALAGERTMLAATVDRLEGLVPAQRTLIVTGARLVNAVAGQLPQLPPSAILGEPCKRDTAPCIGLAALCISRDDPAATLAVMPSDHVIQPTAEFQRAIRGAAELVDARRASIVTFGIKPTYPAESFGYIERGEPLPPAADAHLRAFRVRQFREKPNAETARRYLESGNFFWNSGIFVWQAQTILDALAERQPEMFEHLERIAAAWGEPDFAAVFQHEFAAIRGVSIDYAVMEHARDVAMIEAPFEWDDVGSWQAIARLSGSDSDENTVVGRHLGVDTRNSIIRSSDNHLVVTLGVHDLIVVHTPDATLVANKHDEEAVRQVVKLLEQQGWSEYL